MKTIHDYMDLDKPDRNCGISDPSLTSVLHKLFQRADTATTREQINLVGSDLKGLQGECCKLILKLSTNESMNRLCAKDLPYDFIESDCNDLITFIAGVGVACGDVVDRLDGYESSEHKPEELQQ